MSRISDEELRRIVTEATPGPWRLGADLTTINTAYGGDADFVKGGWAKAIAKTTLPKWMPPKQAWPNGELIALAPALAAEVLQLREALTSISGLGGNLTDDYWEGAGGPNDAGLRGGLLVTAMQVARAALSTPSPVVAKEGR